MTHAARLVRLVEQHANCLVDCSFNCATARLMREDEPLMRDLTRQAAECDVDERMRSRVELSPDGG